MPRFTPTIVAFNGGEVSPLMDARGDTDRYQTSLSLCENFIPTPQGPLTKRPGTTFCGSVKDPAYSSTLYPFTYSSTEGYAMEFAANRIRFWKDGALVVEASKAVTLVAGSTLTSNSHGYSGGNQVKLSGFGNALVDGRVFDIASVTTHTFTLTGLPTLTGTGTVERVYSVAHSYSSGDVPYLRMEQSADVVFITHPDYVPKTLSRASETSWTLADYDFLDGPYENPIAGGATITPSGTSGSVTLTASAVTGINGGAGFQTTDVGRLVRIRDAASNWTWAEITARSSTTVVTATIRGPALSSTAARTQWRLGLWSDTTGYPSAVALYEDRLVFAGGVDTPHAVCFSETGDYYSHSPTEADGTVVASNAINVTVAANDSDSVLDLVNDENGLLVGTASWENVISSGSSTEALSPLNVSVVNATRHGFSYVKAVKADKSILFFQRGRTVLREIGYVAERGGYSSASLSVVATHATAGGVVDASFEELPFPILWAVRADGQLIGLSYDKNSSAIGWHRHILGGDGIVEKVCTVPTSTARQEDTYLVVRRTIDGSTVRYVEYIDDPWNFESALETANFADCSVLYDDVSTSTVSGLWWLEGETVGVLVDGGSHPDVTIADGVATLERAGTQIRIGYHVASRGKTMYLLGGSAEGTGRSKLKRMTDVTFHLWDSWGGYAGPLLEDGTVGTTQKITPIPYGTEGDTPPPLKTGESKVAFQEGYEKSGQIYFEHDALTPFNLLGIFPRVMVQDGG